MSFSRIFSIGGPMLTALVGIASTESAVAGDYEWIQPRAYTFGSCGGQGDDSVPGYLNQRYYSRYECRQALDPRKCYAQGLTYQRRFAAARVSNCDDWLANEVRSCQDFVSNEAERCDQLAK